MTSPRWARITWVGRRLGRLTSLGLHVHYGDQPPFWTATMALVPRGVRPEVGRHVAIRRSVSDDHVSYIIDWDAEPDYGAATLAAGRSR